MHSSYQIVIIKILIIVSRKVNYLEMYGVVFLGYTLYQKQTQSAMSLTYFDDGV